ncbi:hypothetical protein J2S74_000460 [Evansella vedderi]|uniref:Uncharacterized protein n=1 Tax=Evansella vedderi TaxID=38282 RepID=A0ABT9ZRJ9_9BACI|nr:hypothetical protein [Evansella vedderi]
MVFSAFYLPFFGFEAKIVVGDSRVVCMKRENGETETGVSNARYATGKQSNKKRTRASIALVLFL